eukprot:6229284-Lingulodinium_polyedra.AAC.1
MPSHIAFVGVSKARSARFSVAFSFARAVRAPVFGARARAVYARAKCGGVCSVEVSHRAFERSIVQLLV